MPNSIDSTEAKKKYHKKISQRLKYAMKEMNYTQTDILSIAEKKGYGLKQSTLSKMLSESCTNMVLTNIVEIANILNLNLNELLAFDQNVEVSITNSTRKQAPPSQLIYRADSPQMRAYLNTFNTYFFPTKSSDDKILSGKLRFYPSDDNSKCLAHFSFRTGKEDEKNQPIEKSYDGELVLSPTMSAAYCSLKNEEIGEISYMLFQYIPILYEKLQSRVALILTSSAGDHRMPTAHRMLISKNKLSDHALNFLQGQLYLNESEILISEIGWEKFLEDKNLDESFKSYFCKPEQNIKFAGLSPMPYYRFDESIIRESFLDTNVKINAINLIRQYSSSPKYNKIGSKSDELLYKSIMNFEKQTSDFQCTDKK